MAQKQLTDKQRLALELLTCGKGLPYKEIAEQVNVDVKTLYRWRHEPDFAHFQEELQRLNDERWLATVDIARQAAQRLCADGNQRMVEFVLKNEGYNPSQKVEADIKTDINIDLEDE